MRAAWIAIAGVLVAKTAAADDASDKKADALFEEAQRLDSEGKLAEACAKFHESLSLTPHAIGTILNVAVCEEKLGMLASALKHFSDARDRAHENHLDQHEKVAVEHIATITPLVPHLTLVFTEVAPETKVLVDDRAVLVDEASNIAVDPGTRTILVSAPGRVPYETKVTLDKSERSTVTIPRLSPPIKNWRRITGLTVGIAGAGVTIASVALGYFAYRKYEDEFDSGHCDRGTLACTPDGVQATNSARSLGTIATVVGIVGVVAAAGGAVMYFTAPKKISVVEKNVISIVPTVTPDGAGVVAVGSF